MLVYNPANWALVTCCPSIQPSNLCWRDPIFINRDPALWGASTLTLSLPQDPELSLLPKTTSQNRAQKIAISLSVFAPITQISNSLERALVGFRVSIFSQQRSLSGSGVRCFHSPCSSWVPRCSATLDHSGSEAGVQGPCLQSGLLSNEGSKPLEGSHTRKVISPYHTRRGREWETFCPLLLKGPPNIPCVQEASGSGPTFLMVCQSLPFLSAS